MPNNLNWRHLRKYFVNNKIFKRKNIQKIADENDWSECMRNNIEDIAKKLLDTKIAFAVFLFFVKRQKELHSYKPIVLDNTKNIPKLDGYKRRDGLAITIPLEYYCLESELNGIIIDNDIDLILRSAKFMSWNSYLNDYKIMER